MSDESIQSEYKTQLREILATAREDERTPVDFAAERAQKMAAAEAAARADGTQMLKLRLAALMAVLSMQGQDTGAAARVGRLRGPAWSEDHRRMNSGEVGLANWRNSRSGWR